MGFYEDKEKRCREALKNLTDVEREAVIFAFNEAGIIRGGGFNSADITHSSLLQRLLNGDEPLSKAPPRTFSYPNYSLGEGRETEILEIWQDKSAESNDVWVIDQSIWYKVKENIFRWPASGELFELRDYGSYKTLQKMSMTIV